MGSIRQLSPRSLNLLLEGRTYDSGYQLMATLTVGWYKGRNVGCWAPFTNTVVREVQPGCVLFGYLRTGEASGIWREDVR